MQTPAEKTWAATQDLLRPMLHAEVFKLWFEPIEAVGLERNSITLQIADDFCELWLKENYLGLIQDVLQRASGQQLQVKFQVRPDPATTVPATDSGMAKVTERDDPVRRDDPPLEFAVHSKNTFEAFVVGTNNNLAHAAALAVAQAPGKSYNPLFVYGGVGLGKTHLLHAIEQYLTRHQKGVCVAYVSSETFTNEFIDGIQNN
jgi:chromosomal replication initiator protein